MILRSMEEYAMAGTVRVKVPELLAERELTAADLMYGARLSPSTAYRLADGKAERISFDVLASLCAFFGVGIAEILEYKPEESKSRDH